MNETFFLAMLFAILAFAGVEPGQAQSMKTCRVAVVSSLFDGC